MKTTVYFYMKNEAKQYKTFATREEAVAYIQALKSNPDCEACGIERNI